MGERVIAIIGAGPGVSGSVARRFAAAGYDVALLGHEQAALDALEQELSGGDVAVHTAVVDITDTAAARAAIDQIGQTWQRIDVLHFNPSAFREETPLELSVDNLLADVALGVGGLLTAAQAARPYMSEGGRITVTGSMAADKPWNRAASLGVQKAGVRNLVRSLDATLAPDGIRAVSVTVQGTLSSDGPFAPVNVAEAIWAAAHQSEDDWQAEVPYAG